MDGGFKDINKWVVLVIRKVLVVVLLLTSCQVSSDELITQLSSAFEIQDSRSFTIRSKILGRKYDLYVKLPVGYFEEVNRERDYPVLYLNDGPHTFKVAAGATHFKQMDKAIVVGISFAHGESGQYSRVRDLTPEYDKSWKNYKTGGAEKYLKFIESEVIPFVETRYRVNPSRRILSGHSLGGSFGAWVLLKKPQLFSSYILTSPSLWFKDEMIFDVEEEYAKKNKSLNVNIFMATGALENAKRGWMLNDMVDGHQRFVKQLRSRDYQGLHIEDEVVVGTDHFSTFPIGLTKGLRWIYQDLWNIDGE